MIFRFVAIMAQVQYFKLFSKFVFSGSVIDPVDLICLSFEYICVILHKSGYYKRLIDYQKYLHALYNLVITIVAYLWL